MSAHELMAASAACNAIWRRVVTAASVADALDATEPMRLAEVELRRLLEASGDDNPIRRVIDMRFEAVDDWRQIVAPSRAVHLQSLCILEAAAHADGYDAGQWTADRRRAARDLHEALTNYAGCEPAEAARHVRRLARRYRTDAQRRLAEAAQAAKEKGDAR